MSNDPCEVNVDYYFDELPKIEEKFKTGLRDSYGKVFKASESDIIPGAIKLTHKNDNWYYKQEIKKDKIVLHFTAGVLHGDIGELTRQYVSTPYVVARDGTIYELFDPKYWSFVMGPGSTGGNKAMSSTSINIEISNLGPLTRDPKLGFLKTWSGKPYCAIEQTDAYVHVPGGFRGYHYFATFTDEQYRAVDSLITNLCRRYGILRKLPALNQREKKLTVIGEGIWSHTNFRNDKFDVGPAFDYSRVSGR